jgi:cytoskeletal protein CcmA (bactofilin family)
MADVDAREIVVRGEVKGAVRGRERVEIGRTGQIRGDIVTVRIAIEEGAQIHSKVEITRADSSQAPRATAKAASSSSTGMQPVAMKTAGELTS